MIQKWIFVLRATAAVLVLVQTVFSDEQTCFCAMKIGDKLVDVDDYSYSDSNVTCDELQDMCPGTCEEETLEKLQNSTDPINSVGKDTVCALYNQKASGDGVQVKYIEESGSCREPTEYDFAKVCCQRTCANCQLWYSVFTGTFHEITSKMGLISPSPSDYSRKHYECGTEDQACQDDCYHQLGFSAIYSYHFYLAHDFPAVPNSICEAINKPIHTNHGVTLKLQYDYEVPGTHTAIVPIDKNVKICCRRSCSCELTYSLHGKPSQPLNVGLQQPHSVEYHKFYQCGTAGTKCRSECQKEIKKVIPYKSPTVNSDLLSGGMQDTAPRAICDAINMTVDKPVKLNFLFRANGAGSDSEQLSTPGQLCCQRKCTCSLVYQEEHSETYHPIPIEMEQPTGDEYEHDYACGTAAAKCESECIRQVGRALYEWDEDFTVFDEPTGSKVCTAVNKSIPETMGAGSGMMVSLQSNIGDNKPIKTKELAELCCYKMPEQLAIILKKPFVAYCI